MTVDYTPSLLWATGSHHNALIFGSNEQAKAAMYYISPYIVKSKIKLSACLTVFKQVRKHIERYPSKAKDTGTSQ